MYSMQANKAYWIFIDPQLDKVYVCMYLPHWCLMWSNGSRRLSHLSDRLSVLSFACYHVCTSGITVVWTCVKSNFLHFRVVWGKTRVDKQLSERLIKHIKFIQAETLLSVGLMMWYPQRHKNSSFWLLPYSWPFLRCKQAIITNTTVLNWSEILPAVRSTWTVANTNKVACIQPLNIACKSVLFISALLMFSLCQSFNRVVFIMLAELSILQVSWPCGHLAKHIPKCILC